MRTKAGWTIKKSFKGRPASDGFRIGAVDGMKGVAILFVVFGHMSGGFGFIPLISFANAASFGPPLFFVVSSFILTLVFLRKDEGDLAKLATWKDYALRRLLRVYPLYVLALLAAFSLSTVGIRIYPGSKGYIFTSLELVKHLLLLDGVGLFWFIPILMQFYFIVFPLTIFLFVKVLRRNLAAIVIAVLLLSAVELLAWPQAEKPIKAAIPFLKQWFPAWLPVFLSGSLAAVLYLKAKESKLFSAWSSRLAMELTAIASFGFVFIAIPSIWNSITSLRLDAVFGSLYPKDVLGWLWCIFALSSLLGTGFMRRLLEFGGLRFIGLMSLSVYLWHMFVVRFVHVYIHTNPAIETVLVVVGIFLVSVTSYVLVEKPLQAFTARLVPAS